jgi:hypothetical protein
MIRKLASALVFSVITVAIIAISVGCSTASASKSTDGTRRNGELAASTVKNSENNESKLATIEIVPNGPADTVKAFYTRLRERRFREAIFLTNLRPAIEGLTDEELRDFQVDFEALSKLVPEQIQINGEIVSGNDATVTANLPNNNNDKLELQEVRLRKENDVWVILTVDEPTEEKIRKEGKNYFHALKVETHQEEARFMLERISKAQIVFSLQNEGRYGEMDELIAAGFLPDDVKTADSTGYNYVIKVADGKKSYFATATPAVYGKTGKLSFVMEPREKGMPKIDSKDNNGQPLKR